MISRYERWRWQIFGITWLIYASMYLTRQSFGVAKLALEKDPRVSLSRGDFGVVDSAFATAYMVGQFLFGPLGDRFGPRKVLLAGLAVSAATAAAGGFSKTFAAFLACGVLQGLAQATGWSNTNKAMSAWFSVGERGRVIGWWCTHYPAGNTVALPFTGWLMDAFARSTSQVSQAASSAPYWQAAFWGPAAVVAVVLLLAFFLLQDQPEDVGLPPIDKQADVDPEASEVEPTPPVYESGESAWQVIGRILTSRTIWQLSVAYFSIKLTRYTFYFWGPKYVAETIGQGATESTLTAAALPIGGVLGVIAIGYASDNWFQARRAPAAILSLLAAACVISAGLYPIENIWGMRIFFFLVGFFIFGPDSIISSTAAVDFGTRRGSGTATGFVNGVGSLGGILGGWLPGVLTTENDWTPLFMIFFVGLIASALLLSPLWRAKPPSN